MLQPEHYANRQDRLNPAGIQTPAQPTRARKMLVLAPLSTLRAVWYDSAVATLPDTSVFLLVGDKKKMRAGHREQP